MSFSLNDSFYCVINKIEESICYNIFRFVKKSDDSTIKIHKNQHFAINSVLFSLDIQYSSNFC